MAHLFALLGLEVRPWLEVEQVEAAWRERAQRLHPDQQAGDRAAFAELQAARRVLTEPGPRLKLLLAEAWPGWSAGLAGWESDWESLLARVSQTLTAAKDLVGRWTAAQSQLGKALLAREQAQVLAELQQRLAEVAQQWAVVEQRLQEADALFVDGDRGENLRRELETLRGNFGWLTKWRAQLMELVGELF